MEGSLRAAAAALGTAASRSGALSRGCLLYDREKGVSEGRRGCEEVWLMVRARGRGV